MGVIDAAQRLMPVIWVVRRGCCNLLLHDDQQDVAGQHPTLILRRLELLAVLSPGRQHSSPAALPAALTGRWGPCRSHGLLDGQRAFLQRPGPLRIPQVLQDLGQVVQAGGDGGVVRAVGGLGDGQRAFLQRPGLLRIPQVPQDLGQVVQVGGDVGVVRAVGGLGDGQRAFLQRPGRLRLPQVLQDRARLFRRWRRWGGPGRRRPR